MHKLKLFFAILVVMILVAGCKSIKQKTDSIVKKENKKLSKFIENENNEFLTVKTFTNHEESNYIFACGRSFE